MPDGDADNATRWRHIKSTFSRAVAPGERRSLRRLLKAERGIWQRRYWEHLIRDENDLQRHVDYIHFNPVKHGYTQRTADWPHSSIHRWIACGVMPVDWGVGVMVTGLSETNAVHAREAG